MTVPAVFNPPPVGVVATVPPPIWVRQSFESAGRMTRRSSQSRIATAEERQIGGRTGRGVSAPVSSLSRASTPNDVHAIANIGPVRTTRLGGAAQPPRPDTWNPRAGLQVAAGRTRNGRQRLSAGGARHLQRGEPG
jgi:hypothetical protein